MPAPGYGGYPPGPAYPPQAVRYGGYTAGGVPMRLRHSPGKGLVVGLCGIAALLLSYFALPWISEGGHDVTFQDIRAAFQTAEGTPTTIADPGAPVTTFVDPTVTTPVTGSDGLPPLDTVVPPLPDAGTATPAAPSAAASYDGNADQLEAYADWGWAMVLYLSIAAVVFAAWLVPRDRAARLVTGTLTVPCLGWVNLFDKEGASAPRVLSTLAAILVVLDVVGNAHNLFWDKAGSPDPAIGAWLGIAGSIAVLASCLIGTKREWVPERLRP